MHLTVYGKTDNSTNTSSNSVADSLSYFISNLVLISFNQSINLMIGYYEFDNIQLLVTGLLVYTPLQTVCLTHGVCRQPLHQPGPLAQFITHQGQVFLHLGRILGYV